ncbi:hypothetical protein K438DRAFT_1780693 [Mycena galopus ATCC 62051]|nr:hypothetical protein K438DRAFT_1780693 [Mycena galopus ATCC 62051]
MSDDHQSNGDGDGSNSDSHSLVGMPDKKHQVVNFNVEDLEGEDLMDGTLSGLRATTHRSYNPRLPANPFRKHCRCIVAGPNVRATAQHQRCGLLSTKHLQALTQDFNAWEVEHKECMLDLAEKHGIKVAECSLGHRVGEQHTIPKVKEMVAEDPSMLEGPSKEEEKEMIKETLANHQMKARGTCANHLFAAANVKRTMDRLMVEMQITNFAKCHAHDKTLPGMIQSWGALEFFFKVLKRDLTDITHIFELKTTKNKLLSMQQECTSIIMMGLRKDDLECHKVHDELQELYLEVVSHVPAATPTRLSQVWYDVVEGFGVSGKTKLIEQYDEMVENRDIKVKEKTKKMRSRKAKKAVIAEHKEEPRLHKPAAKLRLFQNTQNVQCLVAGAREEREGVQQQGETQVVKGREEASMKQKRAESEEGDEDGQVGKKREGAGKKRKRAQGDEGDGGRKRKKCTEESNGAFVDGGCEHPRLKLLYCHRMTPTDKCAPSPNISRHANRCSPSPTGSTDAACTTIKRSGSSRPNMVQGSGKGKGPPGLKVW